MKTILSLIQNNAYIQIGNLSLIFSGFLLQVIIINLSIISIEEFAYYKLAISLVLSFSLIFTSGIPMYAIRMRKNSQIDIEQFRGLFYVNFFLSIIFAFVLYLSLSLLAPSLIENQDYVYLLTAVLITFPSYIMYNYLLSEENVKGDYRKQGIYIIFSQLLKFTLGIIGFYFGGIYFGILAYASPGALGLLNKTFVQRDNAIALVKSTKSLIFSKNLIKYIGPIIIYSFLHGFFLSQDLLFAERLLGPEDFAAYSIIVTLSSVISSTIGAFGATIFPKYAAEKSISVNFIKELGTILLIGFVISALISIFSTTLVEVVFNVSLSVDLPSLTLLSGLSYLIYALRGLIAVFLQSIGRPFLSLSITVFGYLLMSAAGYSIITNYGIYGSSMLLGIVNIAAIAFFLIFIASSALYSRK